MFFFLRKKLQTAPAKTMLQITIFFKKNKARDNLLTFFGQANVNE